MQINVWILAYKQNLEALARQLYDYWFVPSKGGIPQKKCPKDDDNMVVKCI